MSGLVKSKALWGARVRAFVILLATIVLAGCGGELASPAPTATPDPVLQGKIVFSKQPSVQPEGSEPPGSDLFLINANGSNEVQITAGAKVQGEVAWSPDGAAVAFSGLNEAGLLQISVVRLTPGQSPQTVRLGDGKSDETFPAWSPDGAQIAFASKRSGGYQVYVMNADGGNVRQISKDFGYAGWPAWSPDGSRIAFVAGEVAASGSLVKSELHTIKPDGSDLKKLTDFGTVLIRPRWSPDGRQIVFSFRRADAVSTPKIYLTNADGSGQRAVTEGDSRDNGPVWSPDSQRLVYYSNANGTNRDNLFSAAAASPGSRQLTSESGLYPTFSPDSKQVIFSRKVGEQTQLHVMNADGGNQRQLTFSTGSHDFPAWTK